MNEGFLGTDGALSAGGAQFNKDILITEAIINVIEVSLLVHFWCMRYINSSAGRGFSCKHFIFYPPLMSSFMSAHIHLVSDVNRGLNDKVHYKDNLVGKPQSSHYLDMCLMLCIYSSKSQSTV